MLTLIGALVSVDIFSDRHLTRPFLIPGAYLQAVHAKPFYKLAYLRKLAQQCADGPTVIIADAWPWDFEYHIARGNFPAREQSLAQPGRADVPAFFLRENEACIFLPRDGALQTQLLTTWQNEGRTLKMDAALYRAFFARYDIGAFLANTVTAGPLSFRLFSINSTDGK